MEKLFIKALKNRKKLISGHYGEKMNEKLNEPQEREYYAKYIAPLDFEVVYYGKSVLHKLDGTSERIKTVRDVYESPYLMKLYADSLAETSQKELVTDDGRIV